MLRAVDAEAAHAARVRVTGHVVHAPANLLRLPSGIRGERLVARPMAASMVLPPCRDLSARQVPEGPQDYLEPTLSMTVYICSVKLRSAGLLLKGQPALDLPRYLIGLAVLMGIMLLSLLCAHLLFRWGINRHYQCKKRVKPGMVK